MAPKVLKDLEAPKAPVENKARLGLPQKDLADNVALEDLQDQTVKTEYRVLQDRQVYLD